LGPSVPTFGGGRDRTDGVILMDRLREGRESRSSR
jgi:hypothetical protein